MPAPLASPPHPVTRAQPSDWNTVTPAAPKNSPLLLFSGAILLLCVVYAPWPFASQRPLPLLILELLLVPLVITWPFHLLRNRRLHFSALARPRSLAFLVLLLLGWSMTFNAHTTLIPEGSRWIAEPRVSSLPELPGASEFQTAASEMRLTTGLVFAFLWSAELSKQLLWRRLIIIAVGFTGICLALEGLAERANLVTLFVPQMIRFQGVPFSSFNYHANAGAFLNLCLPAVLVLPAIGATASLTPIRIIASVLLAGLVVTAVVMTGSRGAALVTPVVIFISWRGFISPRASPHRRPGRLLRQLAAVLSIVLVAVAIIATIHVIGAKDDQRHSIRQRWESLPRQLTPDNARVQLDAWTANLALTAGPFGFGPGAFKIIFPQLAPTSITRFWQLHPHDPTRATNIWSNAHNDLLQATVEFGWIGAICVLIIIISALRPLARALYRNNFPRPAYRITAYILAAALAGVLIHSLFDFPLQVPAIRVYTVALLGVAAATPHWNRPAGSTPNTSVFLDSPLNPLH